MTTTNQCDELLIHLLKFSESFARDSEEEKKIKVIWFRQGVPVVIEMRVERS